MATLEIKNQTCRLTDGDIRFLWQLDKELQYMVPGAAYTRAYKGYRDRDGNFVRWDGKVKLMNDNGSFPYGLKDKVLEFYRRHNRALTIKDERPLIVPVEPFNLVPKLAAMGKNPYPYQLDAVKASTQHDCGIIKVSTGGGKTVIAALMTAEFNKKTIIYVIGTDLLYQFHKFFSSIFDQPIGLIGDGNADVHDINIASVWTIGQVLNVKNALIDYEDDEVGPKAEDYRKIKELIDTANIHIFDECHLAACDTIQEISKNIHPERIYGMSASPWRDDNADLLIEAALGRRIYEIDSSFLIDNGYLVRPHIHFLRPNKAPKFNNYQTAYSSYIVNNPDRNDMIENGVEALVDEGRQTLVLFSSLQHGRALFAQISKNIPSILLSGKDSIEVRDEALLSLKEGKIKCLIASRIMDIGVDMPSLSGLVLAGGGKSSVRALQRIGRVIRKYPDKKNAKIIDFMDQATYLSDHSKARNKIYKMEKGFKVIDGWEEDE